MGNNTASITNPLPINSQPRQPWSTLYSIEGVTIIIVNVIAILAFINNRRIFGRGACMIINLGIADLLFGMMLFSLAILNWIAVSINILHSIAYLQAKAILITLVQLCVASSGTCLVMLSVDRLFAAYFPFRYRSTKQTSYAFIITFGWCLCLILGIVFYVIPSNAAISIRNTYAVIVLCGILVIISSYTAIYLKLRSQAKLSNIAALAAQVRERNMAYTLMLVTFCSMLTWLPIGLVLLIGQRTIGQLPDEITGFAMLLLASNSFINPIIYIYRMREFRKVVLELFGRCLQCQIHPGTDS